MKKITIHIGTHKTGTTSIQHFVNKNRARILKEGVLIPKSGRLERAGHHLISWELSDDFRLKQKTGFIDSLLGELQISSLDRAFISSEDFEFLSNYPDRLEYFDSALRKIGYEPDYLAFFRNPDDYAKSLYWELKKHGMQWPEKQFRNQLEQHNAISFRDGWHFDFDKDRFANRWKSCVNSKLTIYDYDTIKSTSGIIPKVLSHIEVSGPLIKKGEDMQHYNRR